MNPTKISGICGRLMCCLKYEADVYKEAKDELPYKGAFVLSAYDESDLADLAALDEEPTAVPELEQEVDEAASGGDAAQEGVHEEESSAADGKPAKTEKPPRSKRKKSGSKKKWKRPRRQS